MINRLQCLMSAWWLGKIICLVGVIYFFTSLPYSRGLDFLYISSGRIYELSMMRDFFFLLQSALMRL